MWSGMQGQEATAVAVTEDTSSCKIKYERNAIVQTIKLQIKIRPCNKVTIPHNEQSENTLCIQSI